MARIVVSDVNNSEWQWVVDSVTLKPSLTPEMIEQITQNFKCINIFSNYFPTPYIFEIYKTVIASAI